MADKVQQELEATASDHRRVVTFACPKCCTYDEGRKCSDCGLTGPEIFSLQKSLPASVGYLKLQFPNWTGECATYSGEVK